MLYGFVEVIRSRLHEVQKSKVKHGRDDRVVARSSSKPETLSKPTDQVPEKGRSHLETRSLS